MKLIVEIKNVQPVELIDLAQSMLSLGSEYQSYLGKYAREVDAGGARLYIKEVRSGSVITELVALAPFTLPLVEHSDTIIAYGEFIAKRLEWLAGK